MTHRLIILQNERNNLKTQNGKNLTSCEENSRMSEENDEIEIEFICKNFGNMRIIGCHEVYKEEERTKYDTYDT